MKILTKSVIFLLILLNLSQTTVASNNTKDISVGVWITDNIKAVLIPETNNKISSSIIKKGLLCLSDKKNYKNVILLIENTNGNDIFTTNKEALTINKKNYKIDSQLIYSLTGNTFFKKKKNIYSLIPSLNRNLKYIVDTIPDSNFTITPFIIGNISTFKLKKFSNLLSNYVGENTLLVVLGDFVRNKKSIEEINKTRNKIKLIEKQDTRLIENICGLRFKQLVKYSKKKNFYFSGINSLLILANTLKNEDLIPNLMEYKSEYRLNKNKYNSYASIVFSIPEKKETAISNNLYTIKSKFTEKEIKTLENIVKDSIKYYYKTGKKLDINDKSYKITYNLMRKRGAIIVLKKDGIQRGSIGSIGSKYPLYKTVSNYTYLALTNDRRNAPLTAKEISKTNIEIYLVGKVQYTKNYNKINSKTDGIIIKNGYNISFTLPRVDSENQTTLNERLEELCTNIGTHPQSYKNKDYLFGYFKLECIKLKPMRAFYIGYKKDVRTRQLSEEQRRKPDFNFHR